MLWEALSNHFGLAALCGRISAKSHALGVQIHFTLPLSGNSPLQESFPVRGQTHISLPLYPGTKPISEDTV